MQIAMPFRSIARLPLRGPVFRAVLSCGAVVLVGAPAMRAASNVAVVDAQTISSLQARARQAAPREQAQLFADLADKISLLAARQIAEGELEKATVTLHELETCTAELEVDLQKNSKGLKQTEVLLHTTNRRLVDLVRSASGDVKPVVQNALKRLDKAQTALLSAVFQQ